MANHEVYAQIEVSTPDHSYPLIVGAHGLEQVELLRSLVTAKQVLIVTNKTIAPLYLHYLESAYSSIQCDVQILEDGEAYKNQESLFAIYNTLMQKKHHRDTTLIALGGGVIGDLTGFAAATYQRGVRFIQIPTTLLAQIDASVGGKTAINHPLGKNMIGSFYQPSAVLMDLNTLTTLPEREFRAGLAEMIKYGLLAGGDFLKQLQLSLKQGLTAQSHELPKLIADCCRIKAHYVTSDEKERGKRAELNLGHTFAHALEAYTQYQYWLHGEAVAIGLYCAALLSHQMGLIDQLEIDQLLMMLRYAGLAHKIPSFVNLQELYSLMKLDKKIKDKGLRFVVIRQFGDCYLDDTVTAEQIDRTLLAAVEGE